MPIDNIIFELQRRVILFKPMTTMPDSTQLGFNGDPTTITDPTTDGERLIFNSPVGTRYVQMDGSLANVVQEWFKKTIPNGWIPATGDPGLSNFGTDSSTWQLNISNDGVILEDSSSNLIIKNYDGNLGTIIIGGLVLDGGTGYLRAVDGSVYIDPSVTNLLSGIATLEGDNNTRIFEIEHNIGSKDHIIMIYDSNDNVVYPHIKIGIDTDIISFSTAPTLGVNYRAVIMGF